MRKDDQLGHATDEMVLVGIVQSVDTIASTVIIDVKTVGCNGQKIFNVDRNSHFEGLIGKQIVFRTGSSTCGGHNMEKITQFKLFGEKR